MIVVKVRAKIVSDNTGVVNELPVLLTDEGDIRPLTRYLIKKQTQGSSLATIDKIIKSVALLLEYMSANADSFDDVEDLFSGFTSRLYSGTVGVDGEDPSGLYWLPVSKSVASARIRYLTEFSDDMADNYGAKKMNPMRKASGHEERLQYAAWYRRNQNDFLGHLPSGINITAKKIRNITGRRAPQGRNDDSIPFPSRDFNRFLNEGFSGARDIRGALRDKLIVLLMHGAGLRVSEAIIPWVSDVGIDPRGDGKSLVRIYCEQEGIAPDGWSGRNNSKARASYLAENYGRIPRVEMHGTQHVGMKSRIVDHADNYLQVHWFPSILGVVFQSLWEEYLGYRAAIDANHPYAFVCFTKREYGQPYTLGAFSQNYAAALKRIGLKKLKANGYGQHGHRHSYGRRLVQGKLSPIMIKKCLHHKSIESQVAYTTPSFDTMTKALTHASQELAKVKDQQEVPEWADLISSGSDDIYPSGMLSGPAPKFSYNR